MTDEITAVSSNSAALHEAFTETTFSASPEVDTQNLTDGKSPEKSGSDVTSPVTENVSVSRTEQPSLILENNGMALLRVGFKFALIQTSCNREYFSSRR